MQIIKPLPNRHALNCLDNETYVKYRTVYSCCKPWGSSWNIYFLEGTGLYIGCSQRSCSR